MCRILLSLAKKNGKQGVKRAVEYSRTQANECYGTRNHAYLGLVNIISGAAHSAQCLSLGILLRALDDRLGAQAPEFAGDHCAEHPARLDGYRLDRRICLVTLLARPRQPATAGFKGNRSIRAGSVRMSDYQV